jgi:RNA-directed DNA polymerase
VFKAVDDTCPEHSRREGNLIRLYKAFLTPVTRHTKIQGKANPFDPAWESYTSTSSAHRFEQRYTRKWRSSKWGKSKLRTLWRRQHGQCPVCGQGFKGDTAIHAHHIVERCKGRKRQPG